MQEEQVECLLRCARAIVRRLLSLGCPHDDAEDIVQETMVKALIYSDGIPDSSLYTWMMKVAVNEYYSLCRRRRRERAASDDALERAEYQGLYSPDTAVEHLLRSEDIAQVRHALRKMAARLSSLLVMKYRDGMTYRQISSASGLSLNSVRTELYRARSQFAQIFQRLRGAIPSESAQDHQGRRPS